jgi:hypothetical protein
MRPSLDNTEPAKTVSARCTVSDVEWLKSYLIKGKAKPSISQIAAWAIGLGREYVRILERDALFERIRRIAEEDGLAVWRVVSDALAIGLAQIERDRSRGDRR